MADGVDAVFFRVALKKSPYGVQAPALVATENVSFLRL